MPRTISPVSAGTEDVHTDRDADGYSHTDTLAHAQGLPSETHSDAGAALRSGGDERQRSLDRDALASYLAPFSRTPHAATPGSSAAPRSGPGQGLRADLIHGGKSNLTYRLTDGYHDWVLRRPPLGHILATAHDMAREYRVMSALAPTPVPVPAMVTLCEDPSVIGAPFYVMEYVEGSILRRAKDS